MRDEIQSGIRNAIERGSTLEEAIQSFISAGYNPVEVKEAASSMDLRANLIIQQNKIPASNSAIQNINSKQPSPSSMNLFTLSNPPPFGQQTQATKQKPEEQFQSQSQLQPQSQIPTKSYSSPELLKKNPKKKLVIILIVILLVLIIGLAVLMFFANDILKSLFGK